MDGLVLTCKCKCVLKANGLCYARLSVLIFKQNYLLLRALTANETEIMYAWALKTV